MYRMMSMISCKELPQAAIFFGSGHIFREAKDRSLRQLLRFPSGKKNGAPTKRTVKP
jgi:hypothetical protein